MSGITGLLDEALEYGLVALIRWTQKSPWHNLKTMDVSLVFRTICIHPPTTLKQIAWTLYKLALKFAYVY